jgi:hypothetical protein
MLITYELSKYEIEFLILNGLSELGIKADEVIFEDSKCKVICNDDIYGMDEFLKSKSKKVIKS